jgi:hypothetical protein
MRVSYQELVDGARRAAAVRLLADPALAIAEIAYLIGYSEPASFHHAFKRWTGETPHAYRELILAEGCRLRERSNPQVSRDGLARVEAIQVVDGAADSLVRGTIDAGSDRSRTEGPRRRIQSTEHDGGTDRPRWRKRRSGGNLVELMRARQSVQTNVASVRVADETVGSLLDVFA